MDHEHHHHDDECCCHEHEHHHEHEEHCCHHHEEHHHHHDHEEHCCCHEHEHHHDHDCDEEEFDGCCCHHHHDHDEEEEHSWKGYAFMGGRILLTVALILIGKLWLNEDAFPWWVNLIVFGIAYLVIAYDILLECVEGIFKEHRFFDEATLMVLASLGAFALRFYGKEHNEYLEGVLVILLFQIGEMLEHLAAEKSRKAITSAIDMRNEIASVEVDGQLVNKKPEELAIGDIVVLGVGMKAPCDGNVIEGEAEMDESSLTGEAILIHKANGDPISSGTILRQGSIKIRVAKEYKDSTVAKLLELVESNASKKSKATRFLTKFSRYYTPIVFIAAVLVAVVPPLFLGIGDGSIWARWIFTSLSFLVVSCPCAVVISVPLAYFSGLGLASKNGIVVKGAGYFDKLQDLRLVAFDKTGTLTEGKFSLVEQRIEGISEEEFATYLTAAELRSSHPLGKAIVDHFKLKLDASKLTKSEEIAGFGMKVIFDNHEIVAGKKPLDDANCAPKETLGSITYLGVDGKDCGYVVLADSIKESAAAMAKDLRAKGISTLLLSGDKKAVVEAVASRIGIDECHAELLPDQKVEYLHEEIEKGEGTVAYVGDGINDAPSIVLADIGIAMGGLGSDVAVSNADVVLMNDDPSKIVTLLKVAKKTKNRAIFCIAFSLCVKIGIMVASVIASIMGTWALPLWVSVLGDSGVALAMVFAALLLGLEKAERK